MSEIKKEIEELKVAIEACKKMLSWKLKRSARKEYAELLKHYDQELERLGKERAAEVIKAVAEKQKEKIETMVKTWKEKGIAYGHIAEDDDEFFQLAKVDRETVIIRSQTGLDLTYIDPTRRNREGAWL